MQKKIHALFFSPNGTTRQWTLAAAQGLGRALDLPVDPVDITYAARDKLTGGAYTADDLVVIGVPVYISYIPSMVYQYLQTVSGQDTPCMLIAAFGNRDYGKSLEQLCRIVSEKGFIPVGAAAFSSRHCMAPAINAARPCPTDLAEAAGFAKRVGEKLSARGARAMTLTTADFPAKKSINREEDLIAYPRRRGRTSLGLLPGTGPQLVGSCTQCGRCAQACPTGAIDSCGRTVQPELCLNCCACIAACPEKALDIPELREFRAKCVEKFSAPLRPNSFFCKN